MIFLYILLSREEQRLDVVTSFYCVSSVPRPTGKSRRKTEILEFSLHVDIRIEIEGRARRRRLLLHWLNLLTRLSTVLRCHRRRHRWESALTLLLLLLLTLTGRHGHLREPLLLLLLSIHSLSLLLLLRRRLLLAILHLHLRLL